MNLELYLPQAYPDDLPARQEKRELVTEFYTKTVFESLTDDQASKLLDIRDFAFAVVQRQAPYLRYNDAAPFAQDVAIYISRSRDLAEGVVTMMRKRWASNASRDGLGRAVARLDGFYDIQTFCESLGLSR